MVAYGMVACMYCTCCKGKCGKRSTNERGKEETRKGKQPIRTRAVSSLSWKLTQALRSTRDVGNSLRQAIMAIGFADTTIWTRESTRMHVATTAAAHSALLLLLHDH